MNKQKELNQLKNLPSEIETAGKAYKGKHYIYNIINILLFAVISYIFLDVKAGHLSATTGIVICVILGIVSGILVMAEFYAKYANYSAKYLYADKIKTRIDDLNI